MPRANIQTIERPTVTEAWETIQASKMPLIITNVIGHEMLANNKNLIVKAHHALDPEKAYIFLLQTPGNPCLIVNEERKQ